VLVGEPGEAAAHEVLIGLAPVYERHHRVAYDPEALAAAVRLSSRYIADRQLPDKAIDVMDEAGSRVRIAAYGARRAAAEGALEAATAAYGELASVAETKELMARVREAARRLPLGLLVGLSAWVGMGVLVCWAGGEAPRESGCCVHGTAGQPENAAACEPPPGTCPQPANQPTNRAFNQQTHTRAPGRTSSTRRRLSCGRASSGCARRWAARPSSPAVRCRWSLWRMWRRWWPPGAACRCRRWRRTSARAWRGSTGRCG
jgi:ATP-dependent Clp protease ATP-binding subunit ClpA